MIAKQFAELNVPKDARVLDVCDGTGGVGKELKKLGYENIDALDPCKEILDVARKDNIYKNYIIEAVMPDHPLSIREDTYDIVIQVGAMCPGHFPIGGLQQLVRITKPGGIIMWIVEKDLQIYDERSPEYAARHEKQIAHLKNAGKWKEVKGFPRLVPDFYKDDDGKIHVMQVI